ncbi:MAG TPA: glycine betaine ABC transporter substrate-binding protein [Desulfomicrobiaceae bacterium]|nr:glycine betaine ABC transporter substrate-binding protein [Desulfomicrobiaceae bacterium]
MSVLKTLIATCLLTAALFAVPGTPRAESVRIAYVPWSTETASSNLMRAVLQEELGVRCELLAMDTEEIWTALAQGEVDATVSAWLPAQENYLKRYQDRVDDLGPNLTGTRIGLVVPRISAGRLTTGTGIRNKPYMEIDSIAELSGHARELGRRIIGIDPGAGVMLKTREAMQRYQLEDFRLIPGSEDRMLRLLTRAIRRQEWIVVTGWLPHWAFARWNLKFLDDPENVFAGEGSIHTIARKDLQKDRPDVYRVLDGFFWTPEQMGQLLLWNRDDRNVFPYENALRWIRANKADVNAWILNNSLQ